MLKLLKLMLTIPTAVFFFKTTENLPAQQKRKKKKSHKPGDYFSGVTFNKGIKWRKTGPLAVPGESEYVPLNYIRLKQHDT